MSVLRFVLCWVGFAERCLLFGFLDICVREGRFGYQTAKGGLKEQTRRAQKAIRNE